MEGTGRDVDAKTLAQKECPRAVATPGNTRHAAWAHTVASAAVTGIDRRVHAIRTAEGAVHRTHRVRARSIHADLAGPAGDAAPAAVVHVAPRIDAARSARDARRRTRRAAHAVHTQRTEWAHEAAAAAVQRIRRDVDAAANAALDLGRIASAPADAFIARATRIARVPAAATVARITRYVDANPVTLAVRRRT